MHNQGDETSPMKTPQSSPHHHSPPPAPCANSKDKDKLAPLSSEWAINILYVNCTTPPNEKTNRYNGHTNIKRRDCIELPPQPLFV